MSAKSYKKRFKPGVIASVGLAVAALVTAILVLTLTVRVTRGVSRTVDTPAHLIRLELLNGCQKAGIARQAEQMLSGYSDNQLEIAVISTGDFDLKKVTKSFVISRDKDMTPSILLARLLGIDEAEVTYKPMGNNYRQVTATLVLGEDFAAGLISLPKLSNKE
ncbi:MAG: LytR C-terminal domain-containing protein [Candidatus Zixiibacteriota bacterium]|nr:MAG: LytR C-terminal domain-containing protein [candidate division Zixibacteria bacterium]